MKDQNDTGCNGKEGLETQKKPRKTHDEWNIRAVNRVNRTLAMKALLRVCSEQLGVETELVSVREKPESMGGDHMMFIRV